MYIFQATFYIYFSLKGSKINTQKLVAFLYINNNLSVKEIKKIISFVIAKNTKE
jgi:hypothetical protein